MAADPSQTPYWQLIAGAIGTAAASFWAGIRHERKGQGEPAELPDLDELRASFRELREAWEELGRERRKEAEDYRRKLQRCEEESGELRRQVDDLRARVTRLQAAIDHHDIVPRRLPGEERRRRTEPA